MRNLQVQLAGATRRKNPERFLKREEAGARLAPKWGDFITGSRGNATRGREPGLAGFV
jgi:hypothetical protein